MMKKLLEFPYPQICRHYVVCDILSLFEKHGQKIDTELVKAVVSGEDEKALELLSTL